MLKKICLSIILCLYLLPLVAQTNSAIEEKHKRSVYDTSSSFYNKGKLNLGIETGNSSIDIVANNMYGHVNPDYKQIANPILNIYGDYGICSKSEIGIGCTFIPVEYYPSPSSINTLEGNVSVYFIDVRYIHCMWSWRYFYYGFKMGVLIWKPALAANIYDNAQNMKTFESVNGQILLGAHIKVVKKLFAQVEIGLSSGIYYVNYGFSYQLNIRKKN